MKTTDLRSVANSRMFSFRIDYFLCKAAVAIMNERKSTSGYKDRIGYAKKVLEGSHNLQQAVITVLTVTTVADKGLAATDSELEIAVNSVFSALAGYQGGPA